MPKNNRERARDAHNNIERQAGESHADFQRRAEQAHHNFEATNQSGLGSGQSSVKKNPTDLPAASGSLDLLTTTVFTVTSMLGAAAVAKFLGRKSQ